MGAKQQEYTVIPGGEAGEILPPEGCSRESRTKITVFVRITVSVKTQGNGFRSMPEVSEKFL